GQWKGAGYGTPGGLTICGDGNSLVLVLDRCRCDPSIAYLRSYVNEFDGALEHSSPITRFPRVGLQATHCIARSKVPVPAYPSY
ncbi:MAG: hypothetical protein ACK2UA_14375, partial [Anaerolineae bacterium]